jgi:hypothetical protein
MTGSGGQQQRADRPVFLLAAVAVCALVVVPVAVAGSGTGDGGSSQAQASAGTKKLKKQVKKLSDRVAALEGKQPTIDQLNATVNQLSERIAALESRPTPTLQVERTSDFSSDNSNSFKTAQAGCPAGTILVGGGGYISGGEVGSSPNIQTEVALTRLIPGPDPSLGPPRSYAALAHETEPGTTANWSVNAHALCARLVG